MVPMPVSLTDANGDAADPDFDVFRDDHWFVAGAQRAGSERIVLRVSGGIPRNFKLVRTLD
jgi:hypothetical protein